MSGCAVSLPIGVTARRLAGPVPGTGAEDDGEARAAGEALEPPPAWLDPAVELALLLGLLGTVTGMINTFKLITVFGTGDPKRLSSGISEALVTTEYGLIIAVPCLLLFALLSRKSKGILASMEQTAVGFINGLTVKSGR